MKRVLIAIPLFLAISLNAQLFSVDSLRGAAFGALVGGIVGHNVDGRSAEWAAVGAGAGLLLGTANHNARRESDHREYQSYSHQRPSYAVTGATLGGIAGGVIGHNTDGRTAEWAAVGAGTGLLLGSVAEHNRRKKQEKQSRPAPKKESPAPTQSDKPRFPSLIQTYNQQPTAEPSPMASANRLFGR